jgi:hypothetical protein
MRLNKWSGVVTAASPYALPAGVNAEQWNIQNRKAGQLTSRPGLGEVVVDAAVDTPIYSIYRLTYGSGKQDNLVVWRNGTDGSYSLDLIEPDANYTSAGWSFTTLTSTPTLPTSRPTITQDRHGHIYAFFGHGTAPVMYRPDVDSAASPMGLAAPTVAPQVVPTGNGYFIERVDVLSGGGSYWKSPTLVVSGGSPTKPAQLRAVVQGGSIVSVNVVDGGSGFATLPTITIDESGVKGGGFLGFAVVGTDPGQQGFASAFTKTCSVSVTGGISYLNFASAADRDAVKVGMSVFGSGMAATYVTAVSTSVLQATLADSRTAIGNTTMTFSSGVVSGSFTKGTHAYTDDLASTTVAIKSGNDTTSVPATYSGSSYSAVIPLTTQGASAGKGASALVYFDQTASSPLNYKLGGNDFWTGGANGFTNFGTSSTRFKTYDEYMFNRASPIARPSPENTNVISFRYWYDNKDFFAAITPGFNYRFHGRQPMNRLANVNNSNTPGYAASLIYAPDYYTISYRYFTGTRAQIGTSADNASLWQWAEAPVQVNGSGVPYVDITLSPALKSTGVAYGKASGSVAPQVRIWLRYCPDSWLWSNAPDSGYTPVNTVENAQPQAANQAINFYHGSYAQWLRGTSSYTITTGAVADTNKRWWHPGSTANAAGILKRPVVDFRVASGTDAAGIANGTVEVLNAGAGLETGTFFALHFEQANANHLGIFNTVNVGNNNRSTYLTRPAGYGPLWYSGPAAQDNNPAMTRFNNAYLGTGAFHDQSAAATALGSQRFYFGANTTGTGQTGIPARVLTNPLPTVISGGGFFKSGDTASFTLRQRDLGSTTFSDSETYTFRAAQLTSPGTQTQITRVDISQPGAGYLSAPTLVATGGGGVGLQLSAAVSGGAITSVSVADPGTGYTSGPVITTDSRTAQLLPVMRPAMRGAYRCAYRFADWSATVVSTVTATTATDSATVFVDSAAGITPGMVLEGAGIPWQAKVVSIAGTTLTLSSAATATGSVSAVVRDMSKPITYSSFSPITDVDTASSASAAPSQMAWSLSGVQPPARAQVVEFFRTSADQSLVFYRLEQYGLCSGGAITLKGTDTLTDEQLFDASRSFYAAVPVVLPNGNLNAYRFGVPRSDMSVCAVWNDRLWYSVSTSGDKCNTIFFSEYDEFESCPDINEITIQNNVVGADSITAIAPYSTSLMVFQGSHCYSLDYNTSPLDDPALSLIAQRGCLNQRCYDVFDYSLYCMDERGIYSMTASGDVENLSDQVGNYFYDGLIKFAYKHTFFLKVEKPTKILRAFVCVNSTTYPDMALCYRIGEKTWWVETYPTTLTDSCELRRLTREQPVYASASGDIFAFTGNTDIAYRSLSAAGVISSGRGYVTPPAVTVDPSNASGVGAGARLRAIITDGCVTEILVLDGGSGYGSFGTADADGVVPFVSTVPLLIDPPPAGGTQATATATALAPDQRRYQTVGWSFKSGAMEFVTDGNTRGGDRMTDRSVILTYEPTATSHRVDLREFFNNAPYPRSNTIHRDRGTGFVQEPDGARTSLDISATRSALGLATGVAKAQFAGRSYEDMASSDRHIAVEFAHISRSVDPAVESPSQVVLHSVDVRGVQEDG